MTHENFWVINSDKNKHQLLFTFGIGIGLLFIFLTYSQINVSSNHLAAFWLGLFILLICTIALIEDSQTTVEVFADKKYLRILKISRFTNKISKINFSEIDHVFVGTRIRKNLETFYLAIKLKNGKTIGTSKWSFHQDEIIQLARRLAESIQCPVEQSTYFFPLNATRYALSGAGSVLIYAIWYKSQVGPFCSAMWFGSAPALIISFSFLFILSILRRTNI